MKTLERVARAIVAAEVEAEPGAWTDDGEWSLEALEVYGFMRHARAALTALLEPSEEMVEKGSVDLWETAYLSSGKSVARSAFQAMIQQALQEGEEG